MFPFGETVTRRRGQTVDNYGTQTVDWSQPSTDITIAGCAVAPSTTDELIAAGREGPIFDATLYAPFGADIGWRDRIVCSFGVFDVDGEPSPWKSPFTGWEPGVAVRLKRVAG